MAFPAGMAKRQVVVGDDLNGAGYILSDGFTIEPEQPVFWTATHTQICPVPESWSLVAGKRTILIPDTSQDGVKDEAQNVIHGWRWKFTSKRNGKVLLFQLPADALPLYLNDVARLNPAAPVTEGYIGVQVVRANGTDYAPDGTGLVNLGAIGGGGGGGATASTDLTDKGTTGVAIFQSATQADAKTALGLPTISTFAEGFLDDTTPAAVRTTIGISSYGSSLIDDADASAALTTLGVSAYGKTILDDADASTALSTLGVSAFVKTLLDDAAASNARTTLGSTATGDALFTTASAAAARTTLGATSIGASIFTAADVAAVLALLGLSGLAATLSGLQTQIDVGPVVIVEATGTYTAPSGVSLARVRVLIGTSTPGAVLRTGDVWLKIP